MPEITVTETQRERLDAIRSDLEAAYIDTYGHIRPTDVVQYLLDTYTPPEQQGGADHERIATADFQALQAVAGDVEGVPGSGIDTETMRGKLLSTLGVEEFAARLADVDGGDGDAASPDADTAAEDGDEGAASNDADTAAEASDEGATSSDAGSGTDVDGTEKESSAAATPDTDADGDASAETESEPGSTPGGGGPGSILSAANQLLDDHDDKWREGGSDEPYEVDLPDGTTEKVRTKDDVRGLLFKHY